MVVIDPEKLPNISGYVMQSDYLLPNLTVFETLMYAGLLRLPSSLSHQQKIRIVRRIIRELGLKDCANHRIGGGGGTTETGGKVGSTISGGERRRVSIGVQLLTDPSLLFLDEPTSGLDSFTANRMMHLLLSLSRTGGRTIICTVHQPRSEILQLLDAVVLLSKGRVVFWGHPRDLMRHFLDSGYSFPRHVNPADIVLDLISLDPRSDVAWNESCVRLIHLLECWEGSSIRLSVLQQINSPPFSHSLQDQSMSSSSPSTSSAPPTTSAEDSHLSTATNKDNTTQIVDITDHKKILQTQSGKERVRISFLQSVVLLTGRSYLNLSRSPLAVFTRIAQLVSFGIILSLCYLRIGDDQVAVQNMEGFLYECLSPVFIGFLNAVALFPTERNSFYRERQDKLYSTAAFVISYLLAEIPIAMVSVLIYSVLTYAVIGLKTEFSAFLIFYTALFFILFAGESFGIMLCAAFYDIGVANSLAAVIFSLFMLMSGFFRPISGIPAVLRYFDYLMITAYATQVLAINEFEGATYTCPENTTCRYQTGEDVLQSLDIDPNNFWFCFAAIILLAFLYRFIGYLILRFKRISSFVS